MLAIVAMDHQQGGRSEQAGFVLQEALAYYLECSGDIAWRVGEMLWLLIETDLISLKSFRNRLIELSIPKASRRDEVVDAACARAYCRR